MEALFTFESVHLGKAFMEDLEEIGFKKDFDYDGARGDNSIHMDEESVWFDFRSSCAGKGNKFKLETDYGKALKFAKQVKRLEPINLDSIEEMAVISLLKIIEIDDSTVDDFITDFVTNWRELQ
jgi:hypothetical protein